VRSIVVFNSEFTMLRTAGASRRSVDTVEGVLSRGYATPLRGWSKCGSGRWVFSDDVVERRRGRSIWRVRKHPLGESSVERPAA
jgi:hypothetical protein